MKTVAILGGSGGLGADIAATIARRRAVCVGYWRGSRESSSAGRANYARRRTGLLRGGGYSAR